ncbi:hypothetical protein F0562_022094 [Nyssa sinensis]|uniref:Protein kinase domain-containing protein n=1 Tax=Nyssa sinensis TaxID=561372 RepID=A0A5J5BLL4_9ASTE|nr:hypothetical protein F0562_022094 [Nyssa sinensis]
MLQARPNGFHRTQHLLRVHLRRSGLLLRPKVRRLQPPLLGLPKLFEAKRIYYSYNNHLTDLTVGDTQVCAVQANSGVAICWRFQSPTQAAWKFLTITSGGGFSCGILKNNSRVMCWGGSEIEAEIQRQFGDFPMLSLIAGESHACGVTKTGTLICKGSNNGGQLDVPSHFPFQFSGLALGANHSCAIQRKNGLVICWGGGSERSEFEFESIVAGLDFTCGLTTKNLSVICWGPGWSNGVSLGTVVPFPMVIPGPCVQASCSICGVYPNSDSLCAGSGSICRPCEVELPIPALLPPRPPAAAPSQLISSPSKARNRIFLAFGIVGSVGVLAGICTIVYCLWCGVCGFLHEKTRASRQPRIIRANVDSATGPDSDQESTSIKAVGTVGYIDPEYYVLNILTVKSDVYGLGVVLLELLTGKRAVFKDEKSGPTGVVEYAVPQISAGGLNRVLDRRMEPPTINEAEAVELVAYTAIRCLKLEGKERPTINDIVANLERALYLCEDSPGSISSNTLSIASQ